MRPKTVILPDAWAASRFLVSTSQYPRSLIGEIAGTIASSILSLQVYRYFAELMIAMGPNTTDWFALKYLGRSEGMPLTHVERLIAKGILGRNDLPRLNWKTGRMPDLLCKRTLVQTCAESGRVV